MEKEGGKVGGHNCYDLVDGILPAVLLRPGEVEAEM